MHRALLKDPLFVELLAAFIGDGWIEKRGIAMYICGSPTEDKWHYDNFLAPLFSKYFASANPRLFPYWGVYGIVSYRGKVIEKALSLGFRAGDKAVLFIGTRGNTPRFSVVIRLEQVPIQKSRLKRKP